MDYDTTKSTSAINLLPPRTPSPTWSVFGTPFFAVFRERIQQPSLSITGSFQKALMIANAFEALSRNRSLFTQCGSKMGTQKGILVNGSKDEILRSPGGFNCDPQTTSTIDRAASDHIRELTANDSALARHPRPGASPVPK